MEINPKGFTLGVKAGRNNNFLIYHFMALTWPQGREKTPINLGGQFAIFGANVATIKYYYIDEIHIVGSN